MPMNRTRPSPPEQPRRKPQSDRELIELQRLALSAIRRPLSASGRTQRRWTDGRPTAEVAAGFVKPNDRLTSLERLEIYNRQYWFRLMDCLWDDYPGLRAVLGERAFRELRIAYLDRYPSHSFSLRDLGDRLVQFLVEEPRWTHPREPLCLDMARFEWAQVEAFDGRAEPPLSVDDLLGKDPARMRIALQPYITLLEMGYPLDDFVIAIKRRDAALRSEASNAVETGGAAGSKSTRAPRIRMPKPQQVRLAVHRHDNSLYYKRLDPQAYRILCALRDGATIADACAASVTDAGKGDNVENEDAAAFAAQIRRWFADWTEMGWFCRRS